MKLLTIKRRLKIIFVRPYRPQTAHGSQREARTPAVPLLPRSGPSALPPCVGAGEQREEGSLGKRVDPATLSPHSYGKSWDLSGLPYLADLFLCLEISSQTCPNSDLGDKVQVPRKALCPLHSFCSFVRIHVHRHPHTAVRVRITGRVLEQAAGLHPSSF